MFQFNLFFNLFTIFTQTIWITSTTFILNINENKGKLYGKWIWYPFTYSCMDGLWFMVLHWFDLHCLICCDFDRMEGPPCLWPVSVITWMSWRSYSAGGQISTHKWLMVPHLCSSLHKTVTFICWNTSSVVGLMSMSKDR